MAKLKGNVANGRRKNNLVIKSRRARHKMRVGLKKLKMVLKHSGCKEAERWAKSHAILFSQLDPALVQRQKERSWRAHERSVKRTELRAAGFSGTEYKQLMERHAVSLRLSY